MKKAFVFFFALILISSLVSAQKLNKWVKDEKVGEEVLLGNCDRDGLKSGSFEASFNSEYETYTPDEFVANRIEEKWEGHRIVIVFATWCHDSKEQVPRFYKILDESGFDDKGIKLIGVDRYKTAGDLPIQAYNIVKVPTFIIMLDGEEVGRIIETPNNTLEEDLLNILQ